MICTLIGISLIIISIILNIIDEHQYKVDLENAIIFTFLLGILITVFCSVAIIFGHMGVNNQIQKNKIEYDSLCKRLEIINSEYEDISKSDIIKDIADWNGKVQNCKYWSKNLWTNWFYSDKEISKLEFIEY